MTIRRERRDTRTAAQKRADDKVRGDAEGGVFTDPRARAASLERARERGRARTSARRRLLEMGEIELPFMLERRGRDYVGYFAVLPSIRVTARTKRELRELLSKDLRQLIAADPVRVLEALEVRERVQEILKFRVG